MMKDLSKVKRANEFQIKDLDIVAAEINSNNIVKKPNNKMIEILSQKYNEFLTQKNLVQKQIDFSYKLASQLYGAQNSS